MFDFLFQKFPHRLSFVDANVNNIRIVCTYRNLKIEATIIPKCANLTVIYTFKNVLLSKKFGTDVKRLQID